MNSSTARLNPNERRPLARKMRTCPYCGDRFDPLYRNSATCSKVECRLQRKYEMDRERKAEAKGPAIIAKCDICGHEYQKTGQNRRTCGSANCQNELQRRRYKSTHQSQAKPRKFSVCKICGKTYLQVRRTSLVCSEECRFEANRRNTRKHYRSKAKALYSGKCGVCGVEFTTRYPRQRTCGTAKCKKEWADRTTKAWAQEHAAEAKAKRAARVAKRVDGKEMRECLTCETMFPSWGKGNRRCPKCEANLQSGVWDF